MSTTTTIPESHLDIVEQEFLAMVSSIRHQDGLISTNPVSIEWDGEYVRFSTLKQRVKYKNLLANPQITLCITSSKDTTRYIEIRGKAELTDDPQGAFQQAMWKRFTGEDQFPYDPPGAERVIVKIIPLQVSTPSLYGGQLKSYTPEYAQQNKEGEKATD
jgi:PPOX class probable F420-dependent enzyme